MTENQKNKLIADQQLEIKELKWKVNDFQKRMKEIDLKLHCIGGPLNDNFHRYNKKQLKIFYEISELCELTQDEMGDL